MFYTIYKIINKIDGKIYIGKHQTKDLNDGYMGSGKLINAAISKYGVEQFKKEILFIFDNEDEMNAKEAELVTEEFVKENTNYNLCPGGRGGFGYLNSQYWTSEKRKESINNPDTLEKLRISGYKSKKGIPHSPEHKKNISNAMKGMHDMSGENNLFFGKVHSDETKKIMSDKKVGSLNPQYGSMWITNGKESKKIRKDQSVPNGWYKGRIIKK